MSLLSFVFVGAVEELLYRGFEMSCLKTQSSVQTIKQVTGIVAKLLNFFQVITFVAMEGLGLDSFLRAARALVCLYANVVAWDTEEALTGQNDGALINP